MADDVFTIKIEESGSPASAAGGGAASAAAREAAKGLGKDLAEAAGVASKKTPLERKQEKYGDEGMASLSRQQSTRTAADVLGALGVPGLGRIAGAVSKGYGAQAASLAGEGASAGAARMAMAGAAGGGATGLAASGLAGLAGAAGGPIAMAIMAVVGEVKEKVKATFEAASNFAVGASRLDTSTLGDAFQGAMGKVPIFGDALEAVTGKVRLFMNGLDETAQRLAPYSGPLAAAEAMAGVRQTVGDIGRAQNLGDDLAKFVEARSQLEQAGQDLLADMIKPVIPVATAALEKLLELVEWLHEKWDDSIDFINIIIGALEVIINLFPGAEKHLQLIAKNTGPKPSENQDMLLDQLFKMQVDPGVADRERRYERSQQPSQPKAAFDI